MEPYRPLYVLNECEDHSSNELRGLAVLVVVLGALRLIPALVGGEAANAEAVVAALMVVAGVVFLARMPRRRDRTQPSALRGHGSISAT